MILQATHSHLYPGQRGKVFGAVRIADIVDGCDCIVEFADGTAATARIIKAATDWQLQVGAYRTAAGNAIAARRWLVRLDDADAGPQFHILARAQCDRAGATGP